MPNGFVAETLTVPELCGEAITVISVSESTEKLSTGVPPKVTAVTPVKPVPVMVTPAATDVEELLGETPVMTGGLP